MILEQVSLRNWRAYRGEGHHFTFAEGANLLVGPNESGKSTVLEAVRRGLLDRHSGRGREIQRVRPLGSSLGPEVRLVFRAGGQRYAVRKRFLEEPLSEVRVERGGEFQLDHEGDAADRFLRLLLLAEDPRSGTLRPEQRGLAQALWFLQSEDGIPSGRWAEALETGLREELAKADGSGLRGLLRSAQTITEVEAVEAGVTAIWEEHYTPTGRPRSRGEVAGLEATLEDLEAERDRRLAEQERAAGHRRELAILEEEDREVVASLEKLGRRRQELESALGVEAELKVAIRELEESAAEADRRAREASRRVRAVAELDRRIAELDGTLRDGEEAEARLRVAVREHRRAAEQHARAWEDDLRPKLEGVRARITDLQARQRIEQLETEIRQLDDRLTRRTELVEGLSTAQAALASTARVDSAVWERGRSLHEKAGTLRDRVWAAGIRVSLDDLPTGTLRFDPEPERDDETGELVIAQETRVEIDGAGSFTLRSADERLAAFDREARACRGELEDLLEEFGVTDVHELQILRERTTELEAAARRARDLLEESVADAGAEAGVPVEEVWTQRRAQLSAELRDLLERCPQSVLPGMEGWAEERTAEELRDLQQQAVALERSIREEREAEQGAQQKSLDAHERLMKVSNNTSAATSERTSLRERLAEHLESYRDRAAFELASTVATEEAATLRSRLEDARERFSEEVEKPRAALAEVRRRAEQVEERHRQLAAARTDRRARLEEVGALSLDRRLADLESRIGTTRSRLESVSRRARAAAVLKRLFDHRRETQSHSWVEPVGRLVREWMGRLSAGRTVGVPLDADMVPTEVELEGHAEPLPLESLSHGAAEQLVVLLRLALGVVLSQEERQLVVLDDRLVNADDERSAVLAGILQEVAESCQVLVATCRPTAYDELRGRRLEVGRRGGYLEAVGSEES